MARILRTGGTCAITTWKVLGWVPDVRAAMATIEDAPLWPDMQTFLNMMGDGNPWNDPSYVKQQLEVLGFKDVKIEIIPHYASYPSASEYAEIFSAMGTQFAAKIWTDSDNVKFGPRIKPALLNYMTGKYGEGNEIKQEMVAIMATGIKA